MLLTLETSQAVKIGMLVRFEDLWNGDGGDEQGLILLRSGTIFIEDFLVEFLVIKPELDISQSVVEITYYGEI